MKLKLLILFYFFILFSGAIIFYLVKNLSSYKSYSFSFNNNLTPNLSKKTRPKICEKRVWEVNLSKNEIRFFEDCQLKEIIPIAYQAPEGKWYQTPTGYYRVGVKREKHISSIFPVYMNYAVQMYEDFFIHEIPYYLDGTKVKSDFTGGCIRLETDYAKKFFNSVKSGDLIISYKELDNINLKDSFVFPVNYKEFYIRQRFNNPIRASWYNQEDRSIDYIQHSGIDLAPNPEAKDLNVYNIYDGKIVKIVENGKDDHGLGNTVIVEHKINGEKIYSLYGHLESINDRIQINIDQTRINADNNLPESASEDNIGVNPRVNPRESALYIKKGEIIGKIGATGYGCNYWRIGDDGCDKKSKLDAHLHFEIKTKPVLESPREAKCFIDGSYKNCYGYVPHNPTEYGYLDPLKFLLK